MIRDARIPLKIGGARSIVRTIRGVPASTTIAKAWLTVKNKIDDADGAAVFQLAITTSPNAPGQITDAGASGIGILVLNVLNAQSSLLSEGVRYPYDIQVMYSTNTVDTIEEGTIIASKRVTQALS